MPSALFDRLFPVFDETFAATVMAGSAHWPPGQFGNVMGDVHTIMVHVTVGWPSRNASDRFVRRVLTEQNGTAKAGGANVTPCEECAGVAANTTNCYCKWGHTTQYYISGDGTVARLIGDLRHEERITIHGNHTNGWAVGCETGNLVTTAAPPGDDWVRASHTPAAEDIPGATLWLRDHGNGAQREVIASWWTTANWRTPMREADADHPVRMLFSEWQYRAWALLGRFLAEQFEVPRNFPVLPHGLRSREIRRSANWRRILLADPNFDALIATFPAGWNMAADQFLPANTAALETEYDDRVVAVDSDDDGDIDYRRNDAWTRLIQHYRGFHGHGFSGSNSGSDHDCPGSLFDWHRFAREVWDWWWWPFDLEVDADGLGTTTALPHRGYRAPVGDTPLHEYFFDGAEPLRYIFRETEGLHGADSSPLTWELDPVSPVYAMANGELVAARMVAPRAGEVNLSFVLVRHRVYHEPAVAAGAGGAVPDDGRIDYDAAASTVYSLYVHVEEPPGTDYDQVSPDNPDWLNRVIMRFRECTIGIAYFDGDAVAGIAGHPDIEDAAWTSVPPGAPARPTLLDGWRLDEAALRTFLDDLRNGDIAFAPTAAQTMPIQIVLGDFLGNGGTIRTDGALDTPGVRVETFSPSFVPPDAALVNAWADRPPDTMPYRWRIIDWARALTADERADFVTRGIDLDLADWWRAVAAHTLADPSGLTLPANGWVIQVRPDDFITWINGVTWRSEWPKYRTGTPAPARPRSRRI